MERVIILKNTVSGEALTLPVTPKSYPMAEGRAAERLDMAQTGQITLPGLRQLFSEQLEFMLPARNYPFMTSGATADPWPYIKTLTAWSENANVCRYIVTGTDINHPVLLGPMEYGEQDGTNDVYCKLPLYEYRYLDEVQVERYTQNNGRPPEGQAQIAGSYTVVYGDCLWSICQRFYGDGSLAYKLAAANGINSSCLIYPGQVLTLPPLDELVRYAAVTPESGTPAGDTAARMETAKKTVRAKLWTEGLERSQTLL